MLLDTFVAVKEKVADYRTWVSGVRPQVRGATACFCCLFSAGWALHFTTTT